MIHKNFLFGLPIYHVKINPSLYDKKTILKNIKKNYEIDVNRNTSNEQYGNLHHSYNDMNNEKFEKIDYKKTGLINVYDDIFKDFANNTLKTKNKFFYRFQIENYTATKNNQYMKLHQHLPTTDFATVHYLQFDKTKHQNTVFLNMNDFGPYISFVRPDLLNCADSSNLDNSYLFPNFSYAVEEDDMIIFPSVLKHEIPEKNNNSNKLRVTVVCNLTIQNKNFND